MSRTTPTGDDTLEREALAALRRMRGRVEELEAARREPIAVVGLGCRMPGASGPSAFWDLLCRGADAVRPLPGDRWDPDALGPEVPAHAGLIEDIDRFDAAFFGIPGREARLLDPQQRLFLTVAWEALEHAGIPPTSLRGSRTGVFVGVTSSDYLRLLESRLPREALDAYVATGNTLNAIPGRVSFTLGLHGPGMAIDTACSSSLVAVDRACRSLRDGECRIAIAGGVNALLVPETLISFARWGMLAPDGRCKTFDASANGFVRAEGCGVLVLKRLSHAQADGDRVLALLRGSAVNQDGPSAGFTAPNGLAQASVIRDALRAANVGPSAVGYVETHGTGTSLGDPIEMEAIAAVYGEGRDRSRPLVVGAVKSNLGHLESASGVAGLIKTILVLQHGRIPPNLHFVHPSPNIPWDEIPVHVPTSLEPWPPAGGPRLAAVSSFGFSGTNAHVVVEEAPLAGPAEPAALPPPYLLTLSARATESLGQLATRYADLLESPDAPAAALVSVAAAAGRAHHAERLAVVGDTGAELGARLRAAAAGAQATGVFRGQARHGGVAFVYTGQGAQYVGMGRALAEANPVFRDALARVASVMDPLLGRSLLDLMFGRADAAASLVDTAHAQPALFAIGWSLTEMWRGFGVTPSVVTGHSVGEFAAACAAGVLTLEDAARLVVARGRLMQALPPGGAMAAVFAPEAHVRARLPDTGHVVVAGVNAPDEVVVSGARESVASLCLALAEDGVRTEPLTVSHAFHSPLMRPMLEPFAVAARGIVRAAPRLRVVSTVGGDVADATWGSPEYWARQILAPVRFADAMRTVVASGADIVLELGPHPVLSALGRRGLPDAAVCWLPSLRRERDDVATVMASLAELYVRGAVDDWSGEEGRRHRTSVTLPSYPFQRTRHWVDAPVVGDTAGGARIARWCHPLLGGRVPAAVAAAVYQVDAGHAVHRSLRDHRIDGCVVWPGAATIELSLAAARESFGTTALEVADLHLLLPVSLPDEGTVPLQTVLEGHGDDERELTLHRPADGDGSSWTRVAEARIRRAPTLEGTVPHDALTAHERCAIAVPAMSLQTALEQRGLQFGPAFRVLGDIRVGTCEAIGRVVLSEDVAAAEDGSLLHPALLDGAMQLAFVAAGGATGVDLPRLVPYALGRLRWYASAGTSLRAWARLHDQRGTAGLVADVALWREDGALVALVERLQFSRVRGALAATGDALAGIAYEVAWRGLEDEPSGSGAERVLVIADPADCLALAAHGGEAVGERLAFGALHDRSASGVARLLEETARRLDGRAQHVMAVLPVATAADVPTGLELAMHVAQACAASSGDAPPRLWFVTRGAQAVEPRDGASPAAATVVGFANVVRVEQPELACTTLDLDEAPDAATLRDAVRRIGRTESQVARRDGAWFGARIVPATRSLDARLVVERPGQLDGVALEPFEPAAVGAGEVRIDVRASGLNFRDVLCALGLYPGAVGALGGECAGVVAEAGADVSSVCVGDDVMAFAPGGLATSVVVPADFVIRRPAALSEEQAAALPVAYLTAMYGLERLADVRRGERVLVHAATGGVGLAAVHLARLLGAEVFATAGSDAKRRLLRELGVRHVFDSRTLDFREGVLAATDGAGVDVVLNSLVGDALEASLSVLASDGRFLEMGKRDLRSPDEVTRRWPGVRYLPFDMGEAVLRAPPLGAAMLSSLVERLGRGELPPLPVTTGSLAGPLDSFRAMAQARHVGKLVLRQDVVTWRLPAALRPDATYLVTGGLGALGLVLARGLVRHGARHLVLLGRHGPSPEAARAVAQLTANGNDVRTACVDVSDRAALTSLLADLGDSMPTIRGVVHAAGVLDDGVVSSLDRSRLERVLRPKLGGAMLLDELTQELPLDFFVLFSSASSWIGAAGQANYAAANAALDALALARRAAGRPALSVAWGRWSGDGMASVRSEGTWEAAGLGGLAPEQGVAALFALLERGARRVAVLPIDWARHLARVHGEAVPAFFSEVLGRQGATAPTGASLPAMLRTAPAGRRRLLLERHLDALVRRVVGIPAGQVLASDRPLRELGLDSLMTVELRNAVGRDVERPLPATLLFDHPSLRQLAGYLLDDVLGLGVPEPLQESAPDDALAVVRMLSEADAEALLLRELDGGASR